MFPGAFWCPFSIVFSWANCVTIIEQALSKILYVALATSARAVVVLVRLSNPDLFIY